jgi:chorismate synthase
MSFEFGNRLHVSIFGQSHSKAIGVVIDGLPAGELIDLRAVDRFMARRAPGQNSLTTPRKEADIPVILSGIVDNRTCGAPLCVEIENSDTRSQDYEKIRDVPRPMHADYPAFVKTDGFNDIRGGGQYSGRLTAPLCFAGAVCIQLLEKRGVKIAAHLASIADVDDQVFDPVNVNADILNSLLLKNFPVLDDQTGKIMQTRIEAAREMKDSVGGTVECCAVGYPAGFGDPMFDGIENHLAQAVFGIPAVKGVEFGAGFSASRMPGSEHNDPFYYSAEGVIKTRTNHHGGVLGGMSTGMPILMRVAFKPTPSIGKEQDSVSLSQKKNTKIVIEGRHDPCVVLRAVPAVEAVMAIVLLDYLL